MAAKVFSRFSQSLSKNYRMIPHYTKHVNNLIFHHSLFTLTRHLTPYNSGLQIIYNYTEVEDSVSTVNIYTRIINTFI